MKNIRCPQGYKFNNYSQQCDPQPHQLGRKGESINTQGRWISMGRDMYKWNGSNTAPTAWIECEDEEGGWSADCPATTTWSDSTPGWSDESGEYSGMHGGNTVVVSCPPCNGKAVMNSSY
jgi:hypothetical protein